MNRGVAHLWGYWLKLDYRNLSFLVVAHGLAVVALFYLASGQARWQTCLFALLWLSCCSISITGGYHRLLAHRAYRAAWPVRLFYLLFGAASLQNSALPWCADHRAHHAHTDGVSDPYSIARGFLWAHIGWVIFRAESRARCCKDRSRHRCGRDGRGGRHTRAARCSAAMPRRTTGRTTVPATPRGKHGGPRGGGSRR